MIYQLSGMVDACSHGFYPVASESLDWLSICSDNGFIHSFSSVEVIQGIGTVSREGALDAKMFFGKSREVFNLVMGCVCTPYCLVMESLFL